MTKSPAYQYYAADFEMDTADWTVDEVGIYQRLLNYEWVNGALPDDLSKLARIVRISLQKMKSKWPILEHKFSKNGEGKLVNRRMEEERENQLIWREKSRLGGIKSGMSKRRVVQRVVEPNGKPNANQKATLQSSSSINKEKYIKERNEESFRKFYGAYPKKIAKQNAVKAFNKLNPDERLLEKILSAITQAKKSEDWLKDDGKYIPHPATWLNGKRWEDEIELSESCKSSKETEFDKRDKRSMEEKAADADRLKNVVGGFLKKG